MRKILIATPAYSGQITTQTALSIDQAKDEGRRRGWDVRSLLIPGSADIADMRNQILGLFLNTMCDDLLFVDADVSWGPGTFTHIMGHGVDFVAGLYRERTDARVVYPARWPAERNLLVVQGFALLEAESVPAGFLRLRRSCITAMANAEDVHWVRDDNKLKGMRYPFLFDWTWLMENDQPVRKSEDFAFCARWRAMGGQVWADPALKLNHTGPKTFEGDFMRSLQTEMCASLSPADPAGLARAALTMAGVAA